MTPEAAAFLRKGRQFLSKAEDMLRAGWPDEAGRAAYLAGFHAAQALISERQGSVPRTHAGVQTTFALLAKAQPDFALPLRRFLGRAYALKAIADYDASPDTVVTADRARQAIADAQTFVTAIANLLGDPA